MSAPNTYNIEIAVDQIPKKSNVLIIRNNIVTEANGDISDVI